MHDRVTGVRNAMVIETTVLPILITRRFSRLDTLLMVVDVLVSVTPLLSVHYSQGMHQLVKDTSLDMGIVGTCTWISQSSTKWHCYNVTSWLPYAAWEPSGALAIAMKLYLKVVSTWFACSLMESDAWDIPWNSSDLLAYYSSVLFWKVFRKVIPYVRFTRAPTIYWIAVMRSCACWCCIWY